MLSFTPTNRLLLLSCMSFAVVSDLAADDRSRQVDFGTDVRPILAKHCFTCHGPDEDAREADLQLDEERGATRDLGGYQAIKPHDPDASELIARITSDDPDVRMPPGDEKPPLSQQEIQTLKDWIQAGGHYETHWSFVPPEPVVVPDVQNQRWCRGEIDQFLLKKMQQTGLKPAKVAAKANLVRRVYLDLTGNHTDSRGS